MVIVYWDLSWGSLFLETPSHKSRPILIHSLEANSRTVDVLQLLEKRLVAKSRKSWRKYSTKPKEHVAASSRRAGIHLVVFINRGCFLRVSL